MYGLRAPRVWEQRIFQAGVTSTVSGQSVAFDDCFRGGSEPSTDYLETAPGLGLNLISAC
ncbi:hypothetical protein ACLOJK_030351 [Asimina triloba]